MKPISLSVLAAASISAWCGVSEANMAAVQIHAGGLGGPVSFEPTRLEVDHEELRFDCTDGSAPQCTFEARYTVRNPTDAPQTALAAFYGIRSEAVEISVAGKPARKDLTPEQTLALDEAVERSRPEHRDGGISSVGSMTRTGFDLTVEAGTTTEVVATGVIRLEARFIPSTYIWSAIEVRHPWLRRTQPRRVFDLEYALSPIRTWARVGPIDVTLECPESWNLVGSTVRLPEGPERGTARWADPHETPLVLSTSQSEGRARATVRTSAESGEILTVKMTREASDFHWGGPFVAMGGAVATDSGFRTRIGYEITAPDYVIYSLSADTDWKSQMVATPMVEIASPDLAIVIPSFALGLGVPVQIAPRVTAGARLQGSVQFGPVGFVTSVDLYPALLAEDDAKGTQVNLFGRWSM